MELMTADPHCRCRGAGCVECLAPLPAGRTCADCVHFRRTCVWLLGREGTETSCDWIPSLFLPLRRRDPGAAAAGDSEEPAGA